MKFVNDLRVITSAVSLGHDETLIAYENYPESRAAAFDAPFRDHGLIRLAVGLEEADDLIASMVAEARRRELRVVIVSADKDLPSIVMVP